MINKLKENEIPLLNERRANIIDYKNIPINLSHELASEKYIDIREIGLSGNNHYCSLNNPPYYTMIEGATNRLLLRESVIKKLVLVNARLKKIGLELYFFDCYRPIDVQHFLYYVWFPKYLKRIHPNLNPKELKEKLSHYSAMPPNSEKDIDRNAPPPHTTGAAMDVTLRFTDSKQHLFMGTIFDDTSNLAHTDHFEQKILNKRFSISEDEALKNRRILFHAMQEEGIENYPYEWWHFSWGDQMWASLSGNKLAFYSFMDL